MNMYVHFFIKIMNGTTKVKIIGYVIIYNFHIFINKI